MEYLTLRNDYEFIDASFVENIVDTNKINLEFVIKEFEKEYLASKITLKPSLSKIFMRPGTWKNDVSNVRNPCRILSSETPVKLQPPAKKSLIINL